MDQRVNPTEARTAEATGPRTDATGGPQASDSFPRPPRARPWRLYGVVIAAAIVLTTGGWWLYRQFTHIVETDARVAADMVVISSRLPGWVTAVKVVEGDAARKGSLLIRIDDRESRLRVGELDAQLGGIPRRRDEIEARVLLTDRQTQSEIAVQQAAIGAAEAELAAAKAQRELARSENDRIVELARLGMVAQLRQDQTRAALETAQQHVSSAEASLRKARAALAQARAAREELTVLQRQLAQLGPEEERLRAQMAQTALDLEDRTVTMPFDGVVDRVFVDEAEYVTPGQRLLMVHDPKRVRVEANIKETDIRYFQSGKAVTITVDALPGRRFEGTVDRVGQAATSEFALLPNPNPSGNFTKITQRLPVRIAVRQDGDLLKPGMMVELEVRASD
jgi:membrane fusion protein (multidrug efflux system)